jgi:hypothetical protein
VEHRQEKQRADKSRRLVGQAALPVRGVYDTVCKNDPQISQIPQIYKSVVNVFQSVKSVESVDVFRFNANRVVHPNAATSVKLTGN